MQLIIWSCSRPIDAVLSLQQEIMEDLQRGHHESGAASLRREEGQRLDGSRVGGFALWGGIRLPISESCFLM